MEDKFYNKETMNILLETMHEKIDFQINQNNEIITQTKKTNGRVTKLERYLLIVAVATATLLFTNGSELVNFVMNII